MLHQVKQRMHMGAVKRNAPGRAPTSRHNCDLIVANTEMLNNEMSQRGRIGEEKALGVNIHEQSKLNMT